METKNNREPAICPQIKQKTATRCLKDSRQILVLAKKLGEQLLQTAREQAKEHLEFTLKQAEDLGRAKAALILADSQAIRSKTLLENRNLLISLALSVAEEVIGEASAIHPEAITSRIDRALTSIAQASRATIAVNPKDLQRVEEHLPGLTDSGNKGFCLSVRQDPSIPVGDALIETNFGTISASLKAHLHAIRMRIADQLPTAPTPVVTSELQGAE